VEILKEGNNGLYTNEWLLADTKTNEIAMFELGTGKSKLYRSSKKEWPGGTEGFYWGCNNTKDLQVRLETLATLEGRPGSAVFKPSDRDKAWLRLYDAHKGKIDADFGKLAFTTPPLAAFHSLDAKFTTTDLVKDLKLGRCSARRWGGPGNRRSRNGESIRRSSPWSATAGRFCTQSRRQSSIHLLPLPICTARTPPSCPNRVKRKRTRRPYPPGMELCCPARTPTSGWRRRSRSTKR